MESKEKVVNFSQLLIWQKGMALALEIYELTRTFPKEEMYGLTSQLRRCSVSIPSNIAEGFYRQQRMDFRRFLQIALGSCAEVETQIIISHKIGFLSEIQFNNVLSKIHEEQKMIKSFIEKICPVSSLSTKN